MTRDYAKSAPRRKKGRNRRVQPSRETAPGWVWLLAGIVIGALITGLVKLSGTPAPEDATTIADSAREKNPGMAARKDEKSTKPRFDFYTLLKETEVIVPEEGREGEEPPPSSAPEDKQRSSGADESTAETAEKPSEKEGSAASAPTDDATAANAQEAESGGGKDQVVYVLQAGSFKSAEDADSVRARLLLLNMDASIEKVSPNPGETWHRVLVGPFTSKTRLGEARAVLTRNGIDSIQLKRRL